MPDTTITSSDGVSFIVRFNNDGAGVDAFEVRKHSGTTPVTLLKVADFTHQWTLTGDLVAEQYFSLNCTGAVGPVCVFRDAGGYDNVKIHDFGTAQFNGGVVIPTVLTSPDGAVSGTLGDMLLFIDESTPAWYLCICDGGTDWTLKTLS